MKKKKKLTENVTEKNVTDIISEPWFNYMNYLSGGDKVINYSWKRKGLSFLERREIKSTLQEIDDLTGISFVKTKKKDDDLRFIYTKEITDSTRLEIDNFGYDHNHSHNQDFLLEEAVVGRASAREKRIKIFVRDNDSHVDFLEKYILRHEIGHALGLGHPRGEGAHPDFTVEDTIMSYNVYRFFPNGMRMFKYYGFTDLDKQALQYNWGLNPESYFAADSMTIDENIPLIS